jgi:phage/plasmid-associated DNA primase
LNYDYKEEIDIEDKIKLAVFDFFKKIQPDEAQRRFTLSYLAYCITGNTNKQVFKMNIGHTASNGKSTEMCIHEKCFEIYTEKADSRVLQLGFDKRHKFLDSLVTKPIRLLYFEELPKGKKLDVEFVKDFVDGEKLNLEKMFGTKDDVKLQTKIMSASNHDFSCDTDAGIIRRGRIQYYNSRFVDENADEENHIYLKEEGFKNRFNDVEYKNAYFHLLLNYVDKLYIPSKNKDDFKEKAEEGDDILNNILEHFEFTNDANNQVTRLDIESTFGKDKFREFKDKLQSMGCKYESQKQFTYKDEMGKTIQKKGVFTKLKILE